MIFLSICELAFYISMMSKQKEISSDILVEYGHLEKFGHKI